MTRLTIGVPCLGQLPRLKSVLTTLVTTLAEPMETELILVDQDPSDRWGSWVQQHLGKLVKRAYLHFTPSNVGIPAAHNLILGIAEAPVIAYFHNDVLIYDHGWDERVLKLFNEEEKIGVVGFAGARGIAANASRYEFWSNMLEAEIHGSRGTGVLPVAMLDGFSLICSKAMLESVGGWDTRYPKHHYYDYDVCMTAMMHGWRNLLCGVYCHHLSGITASAATFDRECRERYGTGGQKMMLVEAMNFFKKKWAPHLPVFVDDWYNQAKR